MNRLSVSDELRDHYAAYYDGALEWRRLGALDKAANVVSLCAGIPHASVLEIGCGDGALLARLAELGFASELDGLEISPSAVEAARARGIPGRSVVELYDGYDVPYRDGRFDVAVLSHVLEHVEHPRRLLYEAARVALHVFVEVPLEDNWRLPRDFAADPTGHINFYSRRSVRHLVQSCGLAVLRERLTNPGRATYVYRLGRAGVWRHGIKELALRAAPSLATRLWTYHGALLCARAEPLAAVEPEIGPRGRAAAGGVPPAPAAGIA